MFELPMSVTIVAQLALAVAMYLSINLAVRRYRESKAEPIDFSVDESVDNRFEYMSDSPNSGIWQRFWVC